MSFFRETKQQEVLEFAEDEYTVDCPYCNAESIEYLGVTAMPWNIDEEIVIRMDKNSLANYVGNLVTKGIMTVNEAREKLGLPWKDGADDLVTYYNNPNINEEDVDTNNTLYKNNNKENEEE